jgi:DNA repair protein RadC
MKERFLREGFENFEPHNILEMLLFFSIPQKDTNELAHTLIDRFGSVSGVFDASFSELTDVPGIKEHSATLLKMMPQIARLYVTEKNDTGGEILASIEKIGKYFKNKYIGVNKETVYLLLLDNKYKIIDCLKIHEGSVNSAAITIRVLVEEALLRKASAAVIAHNHPSGVAVPSPEDLYTTRNIREAFSIIGIEFMAHILVAGNRYVNIVS